MNYKPQNRPNLPFFLNLRRLRGVGACLLLSAAAVLADEKPGTQDPAAAAAPAAAAPAQESPAAAPAVALPSPEEVLSQARARLEGLDSLSCELQQTASMAGIKLIAKGTYTEAAGNRVHLAYQIFPMTPMRATDGPAMALDAPAAEFKPEETRGELLQVSDGNVVYTQWKNGDSVRVNRRNLRDIQEAAAAVPGYDAASVAMDLGVGGMRSLLSRLQASMTFVPVKVVKAGDRSILEVTGRWSDRVRKEVFQLPEGTFVDSRPHIPEYVRVYVDQETMLLRRIQFLKHSLDATQKMARPLLTLDLRNLKVNEPVDGALFSYTPPEKTPAEDQTEAVMSCCVPELVLGGPRAPWPTSVVRGRNASRVWWRVVLRFCKQKTGDPVGFPRFRLWLVVSIGCDQAGRMPLASRYAMTSRARASMPLLSESSTISGFSGAS